MKPRYYQEAAVTSIFTYFADGGTGNPIIALPTGTGKSVVIGDFLRKVYSFYPNQRIMVLTHVKELIAQNLEKSLTMWPTMPAGVFSAGLKRKESTFPITFAGIGSVGKKAHEFGHIDLVIVDECHLISPKDETLYKTFLAALKVINPYIKVIGLTATPYRLGVGLLTEGGLFTDICYDLTSMEAFNRLIAEGFLAPLIPKKTELALNVDKVHIHGGEFVLDELQDAVGGYDTTYAACREAVELGQDRNHWLVFAAGVEHAKLAGKILNEMGVPTVVIHNKMSDDERDEAIRDFKAGKYRAAVNNNILTTGFDFPEIDMIVVLRPTNSTVLWVQMLGRGTRPVYISGYDIETIEGRLASMAAGPKQNCLVLDFARNTKRLGPINDPIIPKKKGAKGGGSAPVRICEACGTYNHASVRFCISCGQEFPRELNITGNASTDELIKTPEMLPQFEMFRVDKVVYSEHRKVDRPPTIQASYFCGLRMFREWICLEHEGFARKKARDWWRQASVNLDPPETTAEGLTRLNELREPTSIRVLINRKYPEIMEVYYA